MCKVYNTIGCLTTVKNHLYNRNINEFKSINEVLNFQKNYSNNRQQIISNHSVLIENEKTTLLKEIKELEVSINAKKTEVEKQLTLELEELKIQLENLSSTYSNVLKSIIGFFKKASLKNKIKKDTSDFRLKLDASVKELTDILLQKSYRLQYIDSHYEDAIKQSCSNQLEELDRKKRIIDEVSNSIYGAFGEQQVVKELQNLPDNYILINDFNCTFYPAIYNKQENDYIKSIQIDHLLIAPSGIFLIETKNWSEKSLNSLSLRSPVQQIKRTNFALFKILAGTTTFLIDRHHWGNRKIPIKNLIVLINQKPNEEFEHVKIITLKELLGYIKCNS